MLKEEQALVDRLQESMMGIALREGADDRLRRLAMGGLIEKSEYSKIVRLMKSLNSKDELSPELRILIVRMLDKLLGLVMGDSLIYQKILKKVKGDKAVREQRQKNTFESVHTIVESDGKKFYVDENKELKPYTDKAIKDFIYANEMYDHS